MFNGFSSESTLDLTSPVCVSGRQQLAPSRLQATPESSIPHRATGCGGFSVALNLVALYRNLWSSRRGKDLGKEDWILVHPVLGEVWRAKDSHKLSTSHTSLVFKNSRKQACDLACLVLLLEHQWVNFG